MIVQPPRAFQFTAVFVFPEDSRTDTELGAYLLDRICPALSLGPYAKAAGVSRIALPTDLPHQ